MNLRKERGGDRHPRAIRKYSNVCLSMNARWLIRMKMGRTTSKMRQPRRRRSRSHPSVSVVLWLIFEQLNCCGEIMISGPTLLRCQPRGSVCEEHDVEWSSRKLQHSDTVCLSWVPQCGESTFSPRRLPFNKYSYYHQLTAGVIAKTIETTRVARVSDVELH